MTDRATSTTLGYVLTLAIATALVTGLLASGAGFVNDRRQEVVREELRVIGQQVAANVEKADRLRMASDSPPGTLPTVEINQSFPEQVTGTTYRVELHEPSDPYLTLNSTRPEVSVQTNLSTSTTIEASFADGGDISVRLTGSDELVIENA